MAASALEMYMTCIAKCLTHVSRYSRIGTGEENFHFTANNSRLECDDKPAFRTRLALPSDYESVADFMCESYYKHEPVVTNIGLEGTEAPPVWRDMMLEEVKAGYRKNCIIGAALNCVTYASEAKKLYSLAESCDEGPIRDIIKFFGYIAEAPKLWDRYCVKGVFELCSIAIRNDSKETGVAKRLVLESWLLARDCSYRLFRMDCNNVYCAQIARGFGWPMIWSIPFTQYVKDGRVVFNHVKEPHTTCQVFVDQLQYCETYLPPYKSCKKMTSTQYKK
ncbi:PREDICTED: uncharacterized protein LOC108547033 [Eufriesea mexicana]|uniref:uncharacterized protein LOC108547033 n=1 Tax=Eufriesea mexicana TaxID=516756 RepID=UPI00083C6ABD|nr:PREDICTED: uncharacterized protein LOC108547033 [Eufriesea mexicana]